MIKVSKLKWLLFWLSLLLIAITAVVIVFEYHTSYFQSRYFSQLANKLTFTVEQGPSDSIWYPNHGPYNIQRGYTQLPEYINNLENKGYVINRQARFSDHLLGYAKWGGNPVYPEKLQSGLTILDWLNKPLFASLEPENVYKTFQEIPPLLVDALLFIENRELLSELHPTRNPVVEWDRMAEAILSQVQSLARPGASGPGGSTLATQMEKYRYSPRGLTTDGKEKLHQIVSASVRYYQLGLNTAKARKNIVRDYVNSTPLSGRAGHGEIHGIGDGLKFWFGIDFDVANQLLKAPPGTVDIDQQAKVFKAALSLLLSQRRPSYYLLDGRDLLDELTASHLRVLAKNGIIDNELRNAALAQPLDFVDEQDIKPTLPFTSRKAVNNVRSDLLNLLGVESLYTLDRIDLQVKSSIASEVQSQVESQLQNITNLDYARQAGLLGDKLLKDDQLKTLNYSVLIYEKTAKGNVLRVQTDNLNMPFDMNKGSKLDLGSTAKLRTLISYLEIIEVVFQNYQGFTPEQIAAGRSLADDPLRQWTLDYLLAHPNATRLDILKAAMQRNYSASPAESFFTAGGAHRFSNFERKDNTRIMTVEEALTRSVNLVFIRMMRDVARYYTLEIPGSRQLMQNRDDPRRKAYLQRFADMEGKTFQAQFYKQYQGLNNAAILAKLASRTKAVPGRLTMAFRAVQPEANENALAMFLASRLTPEVFDDIDNERLFQQYDPDKFNSNDQAYLAKVHPLELWLVKYLLANPGASLTQLLNESANERQEAYLWLTKSRKERAQNSRIRILLEQDAFRNIHQQWQRLGYPFNSLVPSYATALGASADRPMALAELMGIIVNDGLKLPLRQLETLHFAEGTSYETWLELKPETGTRVLSREICQVVRSALAGIVETGTARRLKGVFVDATGLPILVGGKTGTGDHRNKIYGPSRRLIAEQAVNRNAIFTFFIGDRFFGVILAHVGGAQSEGFEFTSGLAAQLLKILQPALQPLINHSSTTDLPKQAVESLQ